MQWLTRKKKLRFGFFVSSYCCHVYVFPIQLVMCCAILNFWTKSDEVSLTWNDFDLKERKLVLRNSRFCGNKREMGRYGLPLVVGVLPWSLCTWRPYGLKVLRLVCIDITRRLLTLGVWKFWQFSIFVSPGSVLFTIFLVSTSSVPDVMLNIFGFQKQLWMLTNSFKSVFNLQHLHRSNPHCFILWG